MHTPNAALAQAYQQKGDCAAAVPYYTRALNIVKERVPERVALGVCLANLERYEDARLMFESALKLEFGNLQVHNNLGMLAKLRGEYDKAEKHFNYVIGKDPNNQVARLGRTQLQELERRLNPTESVAP